MKKVIKVFCMIFMLSFLLVGCGKNKIDIHIGNELSKDYKIVDVDKVDINKSIYYSVNSSKKQKNSLTIEIQNAKHKRNILREDVNLDENNKIKNNPVSMQVEEAGTYIAMLKDYENKVVCEKQFNVCGEKVQNPKKKEQVKNQESKEVKKYNEVLKKVKAAKAIRLKDTVDDAKESIKSMQDGEKKTSLEKELNEVKQLSKINKNIKGIYKSILGVDVVEVELNFNNGYKVFVDSDEVNYYKTGKDKLRFKGKKNSAIYIIKGTELYKVVF